MSHEIISTSNALIEDTLYPALLEVSNIEATYSFMPNCHRVVASS